MNGYNVYDNDEYVGLSREQIFEKELEEDKALESKKIEIYHKAKEYCAMNKWTKLSQYDDKACRAYGAVLGYSEVEVCYFSDDVYGWLKYLEFGDADY